MPYDPGLAQRLADLLEARQGFEQKKMFGGIGWLLFGNMCVGIYQDWLIARLGEDAASDALSAPNVKLMDITGKPMKGWVMVASEGIADDDDLSRYVEMAVAFVSGLPRKG